MKGWRSTGPGAAGSVSFQWERHCRLLPASELCVGRSDDLEASHSRWLRCRGSCMGGGCLGSGERTIARVIPGSPPTWLFALDPCSIGQRPPACPLRAHRFALLPGFELDAGQSPPYSGPVMTVTGHVGEFRSTASGQALTRSDGTVGPYLPPFHPFRRIRLVKVYHHD